MSSRGFGGIVRSNRTEPPDSGTITGMQNGLSSVGNKGELGGNPLTHPTNFDVQGNQFRINDLAISVFNLDPSNNEFSIGKLATGSGFALDNNTLSITLQTGITVLAFSKIGNFYSFGDIDLSQNGGKILLNDIGNVLEFRNSANNLGININGVAGFTGTVVAPASITVNNGIVTNIT